MKKITAKRIHLSYDFYFLISFTAGCFGFGWIPFGIVVLLSTFGVIDYLKNINYD